MIIGRIQKMRDENKDIYDIRKQEEGNQYLHYKIIQYN